MFEPQLQPPLFWPQHVNPFVVCNSITGAEISFDHINDVVLADVPPFGKSLAIFFFGPLFFEPLHYRSMHMSLMLLLSNPWQQRM